MPKKSTLLKYLCLALIIQTSAIAITAKAAVILVPADYNNIQAAIDAASDNDIIDVNDGIYTGPGNYNIDTKGKEITVKSQNGPGNCIIDCQSNGRAFIFQSGEDGNTILQGFTIKNGFAFDPTPPYDPNDDPDGFGGAIYCTGSSPMIKNCVITDNEADYGGGGIFCDASSDPCITSCDIRYNYCGSYRPYYDDANQFHFGGGIYARNSSPTISKCKIRGNWVEGWWEKGTGGGIACVDSSAVIANCDINENECWALYGFYDPGALALEPNKSQHGGGIYCEIGSPTIIDCNIYDNFANFSGGGIAILYGNDARITGCSIIDNDCEASGGGIFSGGNPDFNDLVPPDVPNCRIKNCLIAENGGYWCGGVASSYGSFARIVNCTVAKNVVDWPDLTGGIRCKHGEASIINSIIWGNVGRSITAERRVTVKYSDVQTLYDPNDPNAPLMLEGNINEDPLFANPIRHDYHLQSEYGRWNLKTGDCNIIDPNTSPCVDAGNPFSDFSNEPEDNGNRINMGAYGNTAQASLSGPGV
ncbi:MAG: right-handed parallel beta-helix repeat-containing protein, partial [Sedimentisphaerales bacterium]